MTLLISWVDLSAVWERIQSVNILWVFLALLCVMLAYTLSGIRWAWLAQGLGLDISLKRKIKLYFLGMFASLFLPSSIGGDLIRGILLAKKKGRSGIGVKAAASVIIDRLNGLYTLVILITICLLFFSWPWQWWLIWGILFFSMWACIPILYLFLPKLTSWLPKKLKQIKKLPITNKNFTRAWWRSMLLSIILLLLLIQAHVFLGIAVGLQLAWPAYVIMIGLVAVATVIPISFNGFGIREAGYVSFSVYFGANADEAAAMAALWVITIGLSAIPGAWVLWRMGGISSLKKQQHA